MSSVDAAGKKLGHRTTYEGKLTALPGSLFARVNRTPRIPSAPDGIQWITWSPPTRAVLRALAKRIPDLPQPALQYFDDGEYSYTLGIAGPDGLTLRLRGALRKIAEQFHQLRLPGSFALSDRMIDEEIDGATIRYLFAFICTHLTGATGDRRVAIYAPLGAVGGSEQRDFPVHADLYPPVHLLNVFDHVPENGSGASLFLAIPALLRAVSQIVSIPPAKKKRIRHILSVPADEDRYEEFYDLLHGDHPWHEEMSSFIAARTLRVPLGRGQGYLVHDRQWLHGREAPRGGVPRDRLHRIIFDTVTTRRERLATKPGSR